MEISNVIQLLSNAAIYASSLFIPILAQEMGASSFEIGIMVSVFYLTYFIASYFLGILSDRYGLNKFLRIGLLGSSIFFALQVLAKDLPSLFWFRALAGLAAGIFPAALEVYASEERAGRVGKFTAYGSLGWALGAILAGFLGQYYLIFMVSAGLFFLSFLVSWKLKELKHHAEAHFFPWELVRRNALVYLPYFLRAIGAQSVWAVFPLYLLSLGANKFWIGIIYFVNAGSQFLMMQHIERFRNLYLFNLGLLCSVMTFTAYTFMPNFWWVFPVQLLLAFSFSSLQVGAHQELLRRNREKATVVGILNSTVNFTAVIGPFLAGILLQSFGFRGVMWFAAMISFAGLISFTKVLK